MDWGTAILAGLVATAVMTALMYLGKRMDMPRMMFSGPERAGVVYSLGFIAHFMMGAIFGIVYGLLFEAFGVGSTALWGGIFGLIHGLIAGAAMGMMPAMHPRMGANGVLAAPGPFGRSYGSMVPAGIIVLHVVFGVAVGLVY